VSLGRVYTVDVNLGATAGQGTGIAIGTGGTLGTEYVLMVGGVPATAEFNVSAIRVSTYSGAGASYPANGTITWRLRRVTGTVSATLVGTGTAIPTGQSTTPAISTWLYSTQTGSGTATYSAWGNVVWQQSTPCTAGANWGEWFTPGFEINCGPTSGTLLAITYTLGASGAVGGVVNLMPELVISE
jgi:hypothetical protein